MADSMAIRRQYCARSRRLFRPDGRRVHNPRRQQRRMGQPSDGESACTTSGNDGWRMRPMRSMPVVRFSMQEFCTEKTLDIDRNIWTRNGCLSIIPIGRGSDRSIPNGGARLTGKIIPDSIRKSAAGLVDAIADRARTFTARSFVSMETEFDARLTGFLLELELNRTSFSTNGGQAWQEKTEALLAASHLARTACVPREGISGICVRCSFTEPVEFLIGTPTEILGARHQDSIDPSGLSDIRPSPTIIVLRSGAIRRTKCPCEDFLDRIFDHMDQTTKRSGEDRLQLRHYPLTF